MGSPKVTFTYKDKRYICNLREVNYARVLVSLDFSGFRRGNRRGCSMLEGRRFKRSLVFDEEDPTKLIVCKIEIQTSAQVIEALVYYMSGPDGISHLHQLLDFMGVMRKDYIYITDDCYEPSTNNPYKANVENILFSNAMNTSPLSIMLLREISFEESGGQLYFSAPDFGNYPMKGIGISRDLICKLLTEQKILSAKVVPSHDRTMIKFKRPLLIQELMDILLACMDRHMRANVDNLC